MASMNELRAAHQGTKAERVAELLDQAAIARKRGLACKRLSAARTKHLEESARLRSHAFALRDNDYKVLARIANVITSAPKTSA